MREKLQEIKRQDFNNRGDRGDRLTRPVRKR